MKTLDARQVATTKAVRQYMAENGLSIADMASRLDMNRSTLAGRLRGVRRWAAEELDRLTLLGVQVPALGATDLGAA